MSRPPFSSLSAPFTGTSARELSLDELHERLHGVEQILQMAWQHTPMALFIQDLDLRYVWMHHPADNTQSEQLLGKRDSDLLDNADDVAQLDSIKREVIKRGEPTRRVVCLHQGDVLRYFDLSLAPWKNRAGETMGLICLSTDITLSNEAEEALRVSEARLRLANEAGQVGVYDLNLITNRVHFSWEMCQILGIEFVADRPAEETVACVHPDDFPKVSQSFAESLRPDGSGQIQYESRVCRPNGEVRWIRWCGRTYFWDTPQGRQPMRALGAAIDITRQKQTEDQLHLLNNFLEQRVEQRTAALRAAEQRTRVLVDNSPDAVITVDYNLAIRGFNPAAERMFGYTSSEIIGQSLTTIMPSPYREYCPERIANYLRTREPVIIGHAREVLGFRRDGSTFNVELRVSDVPELGIFIGTLRDVSERKQLLRDVLEIAAEQQRRLGYELHDGVGQAIAGHSLFASSLVNSLQRLGAQPELPDRLRSTLHELQSTAERLTANLADTQRQVNLLSHGILPVAVDQQGLRAALERLAAQYHYMPQMSVMVHAAADVELADNTMAQHLFCIAQEAVLNAVRHGRATRIDIHLRPAAGGVELAIADNGVGIQQEVNRRESTGLRTMYYRASLIGAELRIDSNPENGTVVQCLLNDQRNPSAPAIR